MQKHSGYNLGKNKIGSKSYYLQIFKKNPIDLFSLYAFFI